MNKLTLNLLILLTIPCILYGRNFNVMDFGARGNGISDDAIAIQKAVDACTNAGGGRCGLFRQSYIPFRTRTVEIECEHRSGNQFRLESQPR